MSINIAAFNGNLTADPKKFGNEKTPVLAFSIAVDCRVNDNGEWVDKPFFMDCAMFGKRAAALGGILAKGMNVTVSGRIEPNDHVNKAGNTVRALRMIVNEVSLPPKAKGDSSNW